MQIGLTGRGRGSEDPVASSPTASNARLSDLSNSPGDADGTGGFWAEGFSSSLDHMRSEGATFSPQPALKVNSHVIDQGVEEPMASEVIPPHPFETETVYEVDKRRKSSLQGEGGPSMNTNLVLRSDYGAQFHDNANSKSHSEPKWNWTFCPRVEPSRSDHSPTRTTDIGTTRYYGHSCEPKWNKILWVFLVALILHQGCECRTVDFHHGQSPISFIQSPVQGPSHSLWDPKQGASARMADLWLVVTPQNSSPRQKRSSGDIRFSTRAQVYRSKVGDSIQLDCQVDNLGSTVITWYKGDRILSAGNLKILDEPRIDILSGSSGISVLIQNVDMGDQGPYACEVNLKDKPMRIAHQLEVLVPPSILSISGNGRITARKGSRVSLNCSANGHPQPNIHWEREHRKYFSSGRLTERGVALSLTNIGRSDEGTYICVADNQVSQPVTAKILLNVLYPPEVHVESPWVHSGLGDSAQLECLVQGNPEPEVNWYKGSMKLSDGERHSMVTIGNRYILTIDPVIQSDFGNYSCVSENVLGKARGTGTQVTLTGAPTQPKIVSSTNGQHRYSYHLKWKVISNFPIQQHRIEYWPQPSSNPITDFQGSRPQRPDREIPRNSRERFLKLSEIDHDPIEGWFAYNIKGLQPQTKYAIRAQVQNEAGWSPDSEVFEFSTSHIENVPKELQSRPEDELSLIVPVGNGANHNPVPTHISTMAIAWSLVAAAVLTSGIVD